MKQRERKFMCAVGKKGIGKSYQNIQLIDAYLAGNPAKGIKPERVLVLDTNDEYSHLRAIALKDVALFSAQPFVQARRIRPFNPDGRPMTMQELQEALQHILMFYRNGMLLIEDMNKFTADSMKQDLIGALCTNRHMGLDIITSLQGIGRITPKMWQNLNWLRLHKVSESVERHKDKFEDKYEYLAIAQKIVDTQYADGNLRVFLNIDLDYERIYGKYTKQDFLNAAREFVFENYNKLVSPYLKRINLTTNKKEYTEAEAVKAEIARLTASYSQFTLKK